MVLGDNYESEVVRNEVTDFVYTAVQDAHAREVE
jgi:hypothetical protein